MPADPTGTPPEADPYVAHRDLLFTVAYEMLGSAADAEDVVQEAWLRWREVDRATVQHPRAYLVRVVTRLALNQLRTQGRRRETYVGPWLPEPLLTTADVADDVELADSVSLAMLVVLDALSPAERVVFVLREVFGYAHDEIATTLDRSPEAVRQLASRARRHVRARRPPVAGAAEERRVVQVFLDAVRGGDMAVMLGLLAPDLVLHTDGGGVVRAALRPIVGADKVLRFLLAVTTPDARVEVSDRVNGGVGVVFRDGDRLDTVGTAVVRGGRITELFLVRNPAKLVAAETPVRLTRETVPPPRGHRARALGRR